MSYTTVKALWPGKTRGKMHSDLKELRNSWGSAPVVWNAFSQKYLGLESWPMLNSARLWELWKRSDIPKEYRAVFMMTFDKAYVSKKDFERAASDIDTFLKWAVPNPEQVNHWPAIAAIFRGNPNCEAVGLYCTSVSEDPFKGEYDEKRDRYKPTDWSKCWDIYESLDSLDKIAVAQ